ncbi:hypothetical protein MOF24_18065 [Bacillus inaquosorum]|uniref:hypothetical protein n=1 Tax=Bacillus inaquosorum TaxID=483913 RepID=UPI00227DB189|nr:hypothetical protein [Bacillus inaquosorum]MCY9273592.1 hypothetical protein [Bacillus inaquosorum]
MRQVYMYDENYMFVQPVIIEDIDETGNYAIPNNCTTIQPQSFYKAKFNPETQQWFESATQEYIDSLKPPPPVPTDLDKVKQQLGDLTFQLMMGGFI